MRTGTPLAGLVLVCLLVLPASAQLPEMGSPISMESDTNELTVSADEPAMLSLTVTRSSTTPTGTPLDDVVDTIFEPLATGDVTMTVEGAPDGWTVAIDPSGFAIAPGGSQTVSVTISVQPDSDAESGDLDFVASFASPDPTGLLVPNGEASVSVSVTRDDSTTRQLLEAIGPGIWAILGALLVAIIVAIFLAVDSKTKVVHLTTQVGEVQVQAGETASIPFTVENRSKETDRFSLSANPGDADWKAVMPVSAVTLEPGEKQEMHVAITPGKNAPVGSRAVVRIVAVPDHSPRRIAVLPVPAHVVE